MQNTRENRMGTMPIPKLLLTLATPMALSMLVQALYNIVDSIYVSRVNEAALTALSLAFPLQNLMIAVVSGFGVGVNALLSRSLGARQYDRANRAAGNGLFLCICGWLLFLLFGIFGAEMFISAQTSDPTIKQYGVEYLRIVSMFSICLYGQLMLERLLQATGRSFYSMIAQVTGAVTNIILDPIFIFGYLGVPAMGVKGAAIATIFGQCLATGLALFFNLKFNPDIQLRVKNMIPDRNTIVDILKVGIPTTVMQSIGSVMTFSMNKILIAFSSTAVAVFGVYFKLQSFVVMPVLGINGAMVPILSFNYGARQPKRIMDALKIGMLSAFVLMCCGTILFEVAPVPLLTMFDASADMMHMGTAALRIIAIHFPVAAFCIICGSAFQSLGYSLYSMYTSIMRQLVVLIPAAWLLSLTGNVNMVWLAFLIAEVMSLVCSVYFLRRVYRAKIAPMLEETK